MTHPAFLANLRCYLVVIGLTAQPCGCLPPVPFARRAFSRRNSAQANTTQRTPEGFAKKHATPYWRAHETSRGQKPSETEMDGAWETPLPDAKPTTSTAIHAHCLLLYFLAGQNVAPLCAPASRRFFNCFFVPLIIRLAARLLLPSSPTRNRENRLKRTTIRNLHLENVAQHRFGVRMRYRRGKPNDHRIVQALNRACTDIQ